MKMSIFVLPYRPLADLVVLHHLHLFQLLVTGTVAAQDHCVPRRQALKFELHFSYSYWELPKGVFYLRRLYPGQVNGSKCNPPECAPVK